MPISPWRSGVGAAVAKRRTLGYDQPLGRTGRAVSRTVTGAERRNHDQISCAGCAKRRGCGMVPSRSFPDLSMVSPDLSAAAIDLAREADLSLGAMHVRPSIIQIEINGRN